MILGGVITKKRKRYKMCTIMQHVSAVWMCGM
jgi:hypothetical protein